MKLPRPYIPLRVRVQVAERQLRERWGWCPVGKGDGHWLGLLLKEMFGDKKVELHHRPALCNRDWQPDQGYVPDANDPDYLVYVPKDEHDIETRVRGQHGDYSDLAKARKRKRKERKAKRRKVRWPSRPLRSANRWPKKGKQNERFKAR